MPKVAGSIWIEGNNFHYIDAYNREWYSPGVYKKAVSGGKPGSIWQDNSVDASIWYINEAGTGIYGLPIRHVRLVSKSARPGAIWVGQDNRLHWIWLYDGNYNQEVDNHVDTAAVNTHTDSHVDTAHVDTPHYDTAHNDVHGDWAHTDWHDDTPHTDHNDGWHTDEHTDSGYSFYDHSDCPGEVYFVGHQDNPNNPVYYHEDCWPPQRQNHNDVTHTDNWYPGIDPHTDYTTHQDIPHEDVHNDQHYDAPHQDTPASWNHGDFWDLGAHTDVPHSDIAHTDATHQDSHSDTHGDSPHVDHPYYVGP